MPLIVTSAGGVVYRDGPAGPLILMIADLAGPLELPKGYGRLRKEPPEAARREVREETGSKGEVLSLLGETHYFFRQGGQLVSKKGLLRSDSVLSRGPSPPSSPRWPMRAGFPAEEALRRSAFPANTELLLKAIRAIEAEPEAPST